MNVDNKKKQSGELNSPASGRGDEQINIGENFGAPVRKGILYLIPTPLGEASFDTLFPVMNLEILKTIPNFIVEDLRMGRRFLSKAKIGKPIDELDFFLLNEHSREPDYQDFLQPCLQGENVGLMSDAGTPCVADPGNVIVAKAHQLGVRVVPLVGPNSIILSLMASGFNGQNFAFNGYLPVDKGARESKLKELEILLNKTGQTQIFIETPYRNNQLLDSILKICHPDTKLCVASNIATDRECIISRTVALWKKQETDFHKQPAVFLLGK